jgi:CDP-diacylglycerol--serine O-phosphatidyltransferase
VHPYTEKAHAMHKAKHTETEGKRGIGSFLSVQDLFTLLNAASGVLAAFCAISGHFALAAVLLLSSVVYDYLDGKIGRWLGTPHQFGKELDSLADVIGFGMAPAVFVYTYAAPHGTYAAHRGWLTLALVLFVLCGILRLARFNVVNLAGEYIGMPITWNGLLLPLCYGVGLPPQYYGPLLVLSSVLMISPLRIKKWG